MKQLIFLFLTLVLLVSCESNITNPSETNKSNYADLIQGIWQGDSIITEQGSYNNFSAIYNFEEDTLSVTTKKEYSFKYRISNDSVFLSNNQSCKITYIDNANMQLVANWNNSKLYFHKY